MGAVVKGDHPDQMSALSTLLRHHQQGSITLLASTEVLTEIQQLPPEYQGPHLQVWEQLQTLPASNITWVDESLAPPSIATDPAYVELGQILPDEMDQRHVFHAVKRNVEYFATVDERTILSRARQLKSAFPTKFGKPVTIVGILGLADVSRDR